VIVLKANAMSFTAEESKMLELTKGNAFIDNIVKQGWMSAKQHAVVVNIYKQVILADDMDYGYDAYAEQEIE